MNIEQMANAREAAQESRERRQPRYVNLYMSVRMAEALDRLLLEIEPQPTSYEYHHVQIPVWKQKTVFYVRRLIINELQERNDRAEARKEEA